MHLHPEKQKVDDWLQRESKAWRSSCYQEMLVRDRDECKTPLQRNRQALVAERLQLESWRSFSKLSKMVVEDRVMLILVPGTLMAAEKWPSGSSENIAWRTEFVKEIVVKDREEVKTPLQRNRQALVVRVASARTMVKFDLVFVASIE
jgi:hypothetical protein